MEPTQENEQVPFRESSHHSASSSRLDIPHEGQCPNTTEQRPSSPPNASVRSRLDASRVPLVEPELADREYPYHKREVVSVWRLFSSVFLWEILATILASGLLLAIILILAKYHHQPQPSWRYVSLNSVISWLSTIAKACLLFCITEGIGQLKWTWFTRSEQPISHFRIFDSASRGLFGSLDLIWSLRAGYVDWNSRTCLD